MYQATIEGKTFAIQAGEEGIRINEEQLDWDLVALGNGQFHIRYKQLSYPAEVVGVDRETKTVELKIRGHLYSVRLREEVDLLMEKMGMNAAGASKVNVIKAPMPGLIIDLRVQDGTEVNAGDPLLILEAMKMENIIKSPGKGTVRKLNVRKGDSVEKGQVLIEF